MERINDPSATPDKMFTEGNPSLAQQATVVRAKWLNDVQEEISHVIEGAAITLNGAITTQLFQAINALIVAQVQAVPTGTVLSYMGTEASIPGGYMPCDGQAVSRTTYAALYSKLGNLHGAGDGTTTFNLPDLRGYFLRGVDRGRGIDPGRAMGTSQGSDNLSHTHLTATTTAGSHTHVAFTATAGNHSHAVNDPGHIHTYPVGGVGGGGFAVLSNGNGTTQNTNFSFTGISLGASGDHQHTITVDTHAGHTHPVVVNNTGTNESRPINATTFYIIKT